MAPTTTTDQSAATRWSVKQDRLVAAITRLQREPYQPHLAAEAIAARMELRRRLTAEQVAALLNAARA